MFRFISSTRATITTVSRRAKYSKGSRPSDLTEPLDSTSTPRNTGYLATVRGQSKSSETGQDYSNSEDDITTEKPVKFSTSDAYINYKAVRNFYGEDGRDLPDSHNITIAATGILGFLYLIFLRDDIEADGGKNLFQPIHETVPAIAIPLIQSAIVEHRKFGMNTKKLEDKLAELLHEREEREQAKSKSKPVNR